MVTLAPHYGCNVIRRMVEENPSGLANAVAEDVPDIAVGNVG